MLRFIFFGFMCLLLAVGIVEWTARKVEMKFETAKAAQYETVCQSGHILVTINRTPYCLIGHQPIVQKKAD